MFWLPVCHGAEGLVDRDLEQGEYPAQRKAGLTPAGSMSTQLQSGHRGTPRVRTRTQKASGRGDRHSVAVAVTEGRDLGCRKAISATWNQHQG